MSRSDRDTFFERLLQLRSGYGTAADDQTPVLAIDDAIRYAKAVMTAVELDVEPCLTEPDTADLADTASALVEAFRGERAPGEPAPAPEDDLRN